jgi:hypothetical protein
MRCCAFGFHSLLKPQLAKWNLLDCFHLFEIVVQTDLFLKKVAHRIAEANAATKVLVIGEPYFVAQRSAPTFG